MGRQRVRFTWQPFRQNRQGWRAWTTNVKRLLKRVLPDPMYTIVRTMFIKYVGYKVNINTREYWNAVWEKESLGTREAPELNDEICKLIPGNSGVLELGCGNGQLLRKLIERKSCECTGLDFSDVVLEMLKQFGIRGICSKLPDVPCESNYFDAVICSQTLEHLDAPFETITGVWRKLL